MKSKIFFPRVKALSLPVMNKYPSHAYGTSYAKNHHIKTQISKSLEILAANKADDLPPKLNSRFFSDLPRENEQQPKKPDIQKPDSVDSKEYTSAATTSNATDVIGAKSKVGLPPSFQDKKDKAAPPTTSAQQIVPDKLSNEGAPKSPSAPDELNKDARGSKQLDAKTEDGRDWVGLAVGAIGAIAGAAGAVISWWAYQESRKASQEAHEASQNTKIQNNLKSLQKYVDIVSACNVSSNSLQQNNLFFLEAEQLSKGILSDLQNPQIQGQYDNMAVINLLYLINAVSNQHLYNNTLSPKEVRAFLKNGEGIIKKRLFSPETESKFDTLPTDQKFQALNGFPDLAAIYTNTAYLLGRTYIYEGSNIQDGKKYFDLSLKLSKCFEQKQKVALFEKVLSERGGLFLLEEKIINDHMTPKTTKTKDQCSEAKAKCLDAENRIKQLISDHIRLKGDNSTYIEGYKPKPQKGLDQQNKINLSDDLYHQIECAEQLLKYYGKLAAVTKKASDKKDCIQKISAILTSNISHDSSKQGLLKAIKDPEISEKKVASVYKTIGDLLLVLDAAGLKSESENLMQTIKTELNQTPTSGDFPANKWEFIYQIFDSAIKKAGDKGGDQIKVDSYNGLMMVCQRAKDLPDCSQNTFEQQRDAINAKLKNIEYVDPKDWSCIITTSGDEPNLSCIGEIKIMSDAEHS